MGIATIFRKVSPHSGGERSANQLDVHQRLELLNCFEELRLAWFWATDAEGRISYFSAPALAALDWKTEDVIGKPFGDLFDPSSEDPATARPLSFLLRARNSLVRLPQQLKSRGPAVWWELSAKPLFDAANVFLGYRGSARDITQEREEQLKSSQMARIDALTQLANRHQIHEVLTRTLTNFRNSRRNCALFMLDLDRFKQVNDTLGHPVGDALLKQVASRLSRIIGEQGTIGRLGGDEFQMILPDIDDRGMLGDLAQRCIQMVSQPYLVEGNRILIGASVGIAIAPFDGIEPEELVSAADLALYAAKGGGRGQFRFYCNELKSTAILRRQVEANLRDALDGGELSMHYQPIVALHSSKVEGFEALMRWTHPTIGLISPELFIAVAEDTGMIKEMGKWGLESACHDAARWPAELTVAVNVSAIQFAQNDLPRIVQHALKRSGLDPARLVLEITESVFMGDIGSTLDMFSRLKALGVKLALDDFGTGYSSLSYLQHAPYDKIKIDQSFVRGATEPDNNNRAILKAIISMARDLNMETVAEGVEAQDELELVRELGASHVQGYIFAKAMQQDAVSERLAAGTLEFQPSGPPRYRASRTSVIRQIGVIHQDYRYQVIMRNLSKTGARIEGLIDVPVGTEIVVDLGEGQLAVACVKRSKGAELGVHFETPLVHDGAGGLCTRYRVSPYAIEAAGGQLTPLGKSSGADLIRETAKPRFQQVRFTNAISQ